MARFNAGDEIGALTVLDNLRAARDAARQKRADIESAAEGRRIARLALEARNRGKLTTAQVIARYEEVTRLDPGVQWDWVELGRLYTDAGNLPAALRAARSAADTAEDDRDRSVALDAIGDVQRAQGDLAAALTSYRASLAIRERLAKADPGNAGWQRDLSVSHDKIGDVQLAQGDLPAALTSYQASLAIVERLAKADPGNAGWQRDLSVSHNKIGDVQRRPGRPGGGADELPGLARDQRAAGEGRSRQRRLAARPVGVARQDRRRAAGAGRPAGGADELPRRARDRASVWPRRTPATPAGSATCRSRTTRSATCSWRRATCRRR